MVETRRGKTKGDRYKVTINRRETSEEGSINKWMNEKADNEESCPETGYKQEHNNITGMKTLSLHNKNEYRLLYPDCRFSISGFKN